MSISLIFVGTMTSKKSVKKLIGRLERVNLSEWDLFDVEAKIDTGAFSSSLHCHHVEQFQKNGKPWVSLNLLDPEHDSYNEKKLELPISDIRDVKSSNAQTETRIFVVTKIEVLGEAYEIELSLSDRTEMKYPILLGRKFLRKKFIVDVSQTYISKKNLNKEKN